MEIGSKLDIVFRFFVLVLFFAAGQRDLHSIYTCPW